MPAVPESEIGKIRTVSPFASPQASKYDHLIARAKATIPAKTIVAHPCDETSLRGVTEAAEAGIIDPILVGPEAKIQATARNSSSISANLSSLTPPIARPPQRNQSS